MYSTSVDLVEENFRPDGHKTRALGDKDRICRAIPEYSPATIYTKIGVQMG